jgi:hypothetical protein
MKAHSLALDGIEKDLAGKGRCVVARRDDIEVAKQKMVGIRRGPV